MFELGDSVVYRHDVCKIVGYEEHYIDEDDYLVLEAIFQQSLTYYVPVRSLDILLRPVITRERALEIIDSMGDVPALEEDELKKYTRKRNLPGQGSASTSNKLHDCYRNYMKKATLESLIPFIKCIRARMDRREANNQSPIATDREFFNMAESIVNNELAVALGIGREDVVPFIEERTGLHISRA